MKDRKLLNHVTLAEGEATGHSHQALGGKLYSEGAAGTLVLEHTGQIEITHQEHGAFALPQTAREFEVRKVQEFDHAAEAVRNVMD